MEKIFVTLKDSGYRGDFGNKLPKGFAARYNPISQTSNKKNESQMDWAYKNFKKDGDKFFKIVRTYASVKDKINETIEPLEDYLYPIIIDNDPMSDFKIHSTTSRYSTSNKLWCIKDPRGFVLEISTENMEEILMNGSVSKGMIEGSYKWDFGKNGIGKAKLVPA